MEAVGDSLNAGALEAAELFSEPAGGAPVPTLPRRGRRHARWARLSLLFGDAAASCTVSGARAGEGLRSSPCAPGSSHAAAAACNATEAAIDPASGRTAMPPYSYSRYQYVRSRVSSVAPGGCCTWVPEITTWYFTPPISTVAGTGEGRKPPPLTITERSDVVI